MTPSDDLHRLVHSLSAAERRTFIHAVAPHGHGRESNYLRLFDAILEQKVYDEAALRQRFAGERFLRQLSVTKNYLFNLILRHLRSHESAEGTAERIEDGLNEVQILFDREITGPASRLLDRLRQEAEEGEHLVQLIRLIRMAMNRPFEPHERHDRMLALFDDLERVTLMLAELNAFSRRYFTAVATYRRIQIARSAEQLAELREIEQDPLVVEGPTSGSIRARHFWLETRKVCSRMRDDHEETLELAREIVAQFDEHPGYARASRWNLITSLANLATALNAEGDHDGALAALRRIGTIEGATPRERERIFFAQASRELTLLLTSHAYAEAEARIAEIDDTMRRLRTPTPDRHELRRRFFYIEFILEHFDAALHWGNLLDRERPQDVPGHWSFWNRVLMAIVQIELGHFDVAESLVRSVERKARIAGGGLAFEQCVLRNLRRLARGPAEEEMRRMLAQFREELGEMARAPEVAASMRNSTTVAWVEARCEGISIADAARRLQQRVVAP